MTTRTVSSPQSTVCPARVASADDVLCATAQWLSVPDVVRPTVPELVRVYESTAEALKSGTLSQSATRVGAVASRRSHPQTPVYQQLQSTKRDAIDHPQLEHSDGGDADASESDSEHGRHTGHSTYSVSSSSSSSQAESQPTSSCSGALAEKFSPSPSSSLASTAPSEERALPAVVAETAAAVVDDELLPQEDRHPSKSASSEHTAHAPPATVNDESSAHLANTTTSETTAAVACPSNPETGASSHQMDSKDKLEPKPELELESDSRPTSEDDVGITAKSSPPTATVSLSPAAAEPCAEETETAHSRRRRHNHSADADATAKKTTRPHTSALLSSPSPNECEEISPSTASSLPASTSSSSTAGSSAASSPLSKGTTSLSPRLSADISAAALSHSHSHKKKKKKKRRHRKNPSSRPACSTRSDVQNEVTAAAAAAAGRTDSVETPQTDINHEDEDADEDGSFNLLASLFPEHSIFYRWYRENDAAHMQDLDEEDSPFWATQPPITPRPRRSGDGSRSMGIDMTALSGSPSFRYSNPPSARRSNPPSARAGCEHSAGSHDELDWNSSELERSVSELSISSHTSMTGDEEQMASDAYSPAEVLVALFPLNSVRYCWYERALEHASRELRKQATVAAARRHTVDESVRSSRLSSSDMSTDLSAKSRVGDDDRSLPNPPLAQLSNSMEELGADASSAHDSVSPSASAVGATASFSSTEDSPLESPCSGCAFQQPNASGETAPDQSSRGPSDGAPAPDNSDDEEELDILSLFPANSARRDWWKRRKDDDSIAGESATTAANDNGDDSDDVLGDLFPKNSGRRNWYRRGSLKPDSSPSLPTAAPTPASAAANRHRSRLTSKPRSRSLADFRFPSADTGVSFSPSSSRLSEASESGDDTGEMAVFDPLLVCDSLLQRRPKFRTYLEEQLFKATYSSQLYMESLQFITDILSPLVLTLHTAIGRLSCASLSELCLNSFAGSGDCDVFSWKLFMCCVCVSCFFVVF